MKAAACLIVAALAWSAAAQEPPAKPGKLTKRFGYDFIAELYPQKTPQEALQSIVKAIETKRVDYLVAHLADPQFVDPRIVEYKALYQGGEAGRAVLAFDRLVRETTLHFQEDPVLLKELRLFAKEAEWEGKEDETVGTLKKGSPRRVYLRKAEERWFLQNRQH
jgi:hypothetical protein